MARSLVASGMTIEARVAAGIAYLNKTEPGWRTRIDLETLDISHDCHCAFAQLYGRFTDVSAVKFNSLQHAADLGFYAYMAGNSAQSTMEYAELTKAWKTALAPKKSERPYIPVFRRAA